MIKKGIEDKKRWPEWDRETAKVEVAWDSDDDGVSITVSLDDAPVGKLRAKREDQVLIISEIRIEPQITVKQKVGFFFRRSAAKGTGRGYGTMLIKALVAYARNRGFKMIVGGLTAEELKQNRFALEWYSRRGFIVARQPCPLIPGSAASMQMLI